MKEQSQERLDRFVEELQAQQEEQLRATYSEPFVENWLQPHNPGPMEDADGHGCVTGPCGDTMQFWIKVRDDRLVQVHFTTDGCGVSLVCGSMCARLAEGLELSEAKQVTQQRILQALGSVPDEEVHCALLASNTLMEAVRDYLRNRPREQWKKLYRR
ncbi:MAG: iron-sulfur cluster assembly scaffold protein [Deltaproteobacteria bacterium]|nr:iron-sulfur cluster assembly scaffold protein [Deltaproteobacteria bacterium]